MKVTVYEGKKTSIPKQIIIKQIIFCCEEMAVEMMPTGNEDIIYEMGVRLAGEMAPAEERAQVQTVNKGHKVKFCPHCGQKIVILEYETEGVNNDTE